MNTNRAGRARPMKNKLEGIIETCPSIETVAVVKVTGGETYKYEKDVDFTALMAEQSDVCPYEPMDSEDLYSFYTPVEPLESLKAQSTPLGVISFMECPQTNMSGIIPAY